MAPISITPLLVAGAFTIIATATAQNISIQQTCCPTTRSIQSTGSSSIDVDPDRAIVTFGVTTRAENATMAYALNEAASANALSNLRMVNGVNASDIQLQGLTLQPYYEYVKNATFEGSVQRGYEATRTVQVDLNDPALVPEVIGAVIANGANTLQGVQYTLQDSTRRSVQQRALTDAVNDARSRAVAMASALPGQEVGPAITINESSVFVPQPFSANLDFAKAVAGAAPSIGNPQAFAPGRITVTANVNANFDLVASEMPMMI